MSVLAIFAVAGAITYVLRCSMVVIGDRLNSSTIVESTIGMISPAVLSAIVVATETTPPSSSTTAKLTLVTT